MGREGGEREGGKREERTAPPLSVNPGYGPVYLGCQSNSLSVDLKELK